ncbi:MAG: VWA domain-containing protein [candidate division NC10 bacterium]|nr:VWA domain-containing protein [candidate division NC10 bacterium]
MFNSNVYENSRPDGVGVLEILNGGRRGGQRQAKTRRFVPLQRTELKGEVIGPLAALRLTQVYGFAREQSKKVIEAVYRFPLPGDAAVTGVRVYFGDVEIRTELKERRHAEADYEEAKRQGKQAALLSRESPDVFTLHVAGIQPDQDVTVETSYVQLARADGPGWSLRIPLTTAPRYVRSDESASRHAQGQPLGLLRDPGHRFSLDVTLPAAGWVESPTHRLDVTPEGNGLRVRLQDGEVLPDRDCVLSWRPQQDQDRPSLHVWLHNDQGSGQVYFLALVAPPAAHDPEWGIPREVILLVDHSGSMEGAKWEAADWMVKKFLTGLTARDAFDLGLFHDATRWFSKSPRQATANVVEEAVRFLEEHRDSGGTELGVALEQALSLERADGARARHLLIITDAQVTDEGRILRLADQEAQRVDRRRVSVLCIDAAPNSFLALELAERGGGVAKFLTSAPDEEDITTALDEVLTDWAQPVRAGLHLEVNRREVQAAGRAVVGGSEARWSAIDLGDLPAGRPLWVAGRVPRGESPDLVFRVVDAEQQQVAACHLDLTQEAREHHALKALFGARRILGLEFLIHSGYTGKDLVDQLGRLGYDPEQVLAGQPGPPPKVYAENVREDLDRALRGLLVREALHYGLACSETAFVAVRLEAGKLVEERVLVANALPSGWSESFITSRMHVAFLASPPPPPLDMMARRSTRQARFLREQVAEPVPTSTVLFSGIPQFENGQATLFDSSWGATTLPEGAILSHLTIRFPGGAPDPKRLDPGLSLLIFVDDLVVPRARVRLADLVRQGGERPLNLVREPGQVVQIVLVDPAGAWATSAPQIEVELAWQPR